MTIILSASTGGTQDYAAIGSTIGGPTGLSGGASVALPLINSNFGSSKSLTMTSSEIGGEGATVTGGTAGPTWYFPTGRTSFLDLFVILPPGASVALKVTPPPSNTSMIASLALNAYKSSNGT